MFYKFLFLLNLQFRSLLQQLQLGGDELVTEKYVREGADWHSLTAKEVSVQFDRYDGMMRSFRKMVLGEKENPWDCDYELELYRIIMGACNGI